ncbi:hypothetical protein B0H63DRAFT_395341 [Podospora didyma]|uniref:Peptidase M20 dimerisation domain-containing protein n=1 Tax=Podospora didyma TaxID=330526 RepID=A0AAE0NNZ8_9PEZI|nr:hypothetical protein B0H63DRAFT_395341 [Podospora didyma]
MKTTIPRLLLASSALHLGALAYTVRPHQQQQQAIIAAPGFDDDASAPSLPQPPYRDDLLSLHKDLVTIPSISSQETDAGLFLAKYLVKRGWFVDLQVVPPLNINGANSNNTERESKRANVLAFPASARHAVPRLLVTSHIDVVPPYISYSTNSTDGKIDSYTLISGRGSVDAKASVAAQIIAVEELLANNEVSEKDVSFLFVVGEETHGDGMKFFASNLDDRVKFQSVIYGEPTENKLACGHKGMGGGTVHAKGKAGHSGYPWLGKSATELLVRVLVKLVDADLGSSERFGNTTVNIGTIEGGVAANVIPKDASAKLAIRVAAGNQSTGSELVRQKVEQILKETDEDAFTLTWAEGYGPVECECDVDGFETMVANYGTDVPNFKGDHVSYLYGPGSILVAHGDDEALQVRDLEAAVEGYKKLIKHALRD